MLNHGKRKKKLKRELFSLPCRFFFLTPSPALFSTQHLPPPLPVAGSRPIWTDFSADYAWRSNTQPPQIKAPAVAELVSEWVSGFKALLCSSSGVLACVYVCVLLTRWVRQVLNDCSGHPSNEGLRFTPISSSECDPWLVSGVSVRDLHAARLSLLPSRALFSKQPVWMAVT